MSALSCRNGVAQSPSQLNELPPPCINRDCALADISHDALSQSVCGTCRAHKPHLFVAIAYSCFDGLPFCVSCSNTLSDNKLMKIPSKKQLVMLEWSPQHQRYRPTPV